MAEVIPLKVNPQAPGDTISLGELSATDSIGIENGGTGAITASAARANLDVYNTTEADTLLSDESTALQSTIVMTQILTTTGAI